MVRISRDELFIEVALSVAKRSTCLRGQVGAVIVVDKHIVSMGYNGAPPGQPHCIDEGCLGDEPLLDARGEKIFPNGCTRSTHAETNAVAFAARHGINTDAGTMYCTHATCINCARTMVAAGIVEVVYLKPYRLTEGIELLDKCNVRVRQYVGG